LHKRAKLPMIAVLCLVGLLYPILCPPTLAAGDNIGRSLATCHLQAATYFGGSDNEQGWPSTPSTIDADGNILFAVTTSSSDLASGGFDLSYNGGGDVLIVKMNAELTQVLRATYLGGSASDVPDAVSVDAAGRVYVSGSTASANFPTTTGAYDITHGSAEDAFVAVLSADLDTLLASTFIGGNGSDMECVTAVSADGSVFASFGTASTDLPTSPGAIQTSYNGGGGDLYIARLNSDLTAALASTYFGGNSIEFRSKLAIDGDGDIYTTVSTFSSNLPVSPGAYDTQNNDGSIDAYIAHISKTLDAVLASTYVGGDGTDWVYSIMLGANEDVYITGHAHSNWPVTHGCFDSTYGGGPEDGSDTYLCRLNIDLTTLKASTYLGGSGWDWGVDLARDSQGFIYLVGETSSPDFPVTKGAYDSTCCNVREIFLAKFDSTMQTLHISTFIGGLGDDRWPGVLVAGSDSVYVIGYTTSADLKTTVGAYDPSFNGSGDLYIIEFSPQSPCDDGDTDCDGVADGADNCPSIANSNQQDSDNDGKGNVCDNCPLIANPGQEDADSDGIGNACDFICGDANSDGSVDISDAVYLISYIFSGGSEPQPLLAGDANCDSAVDIADAVYLIAYIFTGGSAPCAGCK
jgi:hypothetical protein